jgi:hypothetical protein
LVIFNYTNLKTTIMERIARKDIEAQIRATAEKKMISIHVDSGHWGESGVRPLGVASLDSMLRHCTYEEAQKKLKEAFEEAAEKFELPISDLRLAKGWSQGSVIQGIRLETDEELEARIQKETDRKVLFLRNAKNRARAEKYAKERKIRQLKKELEKLEK